MAGIFAKPKAFNRHFAIDIGTAESPEIIEISKGISSRGTSISEDTEEYSYMDLRGTTEKEVTEQSLSRTFSGNRFIGDHAQDAILIDRMYDMGNREVPYLDWYDNMPDELLAKKGNGWSGRATITIADDGSGDAAQRESIQFSLNPNGIPERGTVKVEDGKLAFTKLADPSGDSLGA